MEVEKNSKVSFGTTLDREIFPVSVPRSRFGAELNPLRGAPHRGPGCYNNEEVTNFDYLVQTRLTSNKGYMLGARTAPRFAGDSVNQTPDPTTYQTTCTDAMEFSPSYKPFSVASKRFPVFKRDIEEDSPGPGTYEHLTGKNRQVRWHQSFGSRPIDIPTIEQHSTIDKNTDKLMSTKKEKQYHRKLAYLKLYYE